MHRYQTLLIGLALSVMTGAVFAQTTTPPVPPETSPWLALIPLIVPGLVALVKWFAPKIPTAILPILCPVLGAGIEIIAHYSGLQTTGGWGGAILGAAGVFVRETYDQLKKPRT